MSFAGFLAQRSEYDLYHADARREAGEIEQEPEEEKSELRKFYIAKGLNQDEAEKIVEKISANKEKFLEDILMHELHVHETRLENPIKMGGVIGLRSWSLEGTNRGKENLEKRARNSDHRRGRVGRPLPYRYRPCICITQTCRKIWPVTVDGRPTKSAIAVGESLAAHSCNFAKHSVFRSFHHVSDCFPLSPR